MQLRKYQEDGVNNVALKLASGHRKVIFQLATGGGKTICFSAICNRYTAKSPKAVLILVHRIELMSQTRKVLYEAFGITAQIISAGMKSFPQSRVYVGMVESTIRRIPKNIGLVIIDECHIASFNKIHEHFTEQLIIGFTATPLSASKKNPLKDYYQDIVCGIDIPDLITSGSLCQNITYSPKDIVDRDSLTIKGGEFDEQTMATEFKTPKFINNTVEAYRKWGDGGKAIVFNVNCDHSIQVNDAFKIAGYDARWLDGSMGGIERQNILNWFKHTPGAILNNVGILTAGFDEPTIDTVIFNKATMSMPLWLQCCGRASRPTDMKSAFKIIDMGGNAITHGDWCDSRDWEDLFHNPAKKKDGLGVAPVKSCPECDAIISAGAKVCQYCGYEFPMKPMGIEAVMSDFVIVTKGIDVDQIIKQNQDKKEYYAFFDIGRKLAAAAKKSTPSINDEIAEFILKKYDDLAKQWCKSINKKYNAWHKEKAKECLYSELEQAYKKWTSPLKRVPASSELSINNGSLSLNNLEPMRF